MIMLDWIRAELQEGRLHFTGYREVQLDHIYSQNEEDDQKWRRVFNFANTSSSTMRYMMLRVTGIHRHFNPNSLRRTARHRVDLDLANPPVRPPLPPQYSTPINDGNHLAGNAFEAKWVAAHFDMLFPHFRIESRIDGMQVNEVRPFSDQMVVVDVYHCIVWNFVVTLKVEKLPNAHRRNMRFRAIPHIAVHRHRNMRFQARPVIAVHRHRNMRFQARPVIAVHRLELRPPQQQFNNYPFPPVDDGHDENIDDN